MILLCTILFFVLGLIIGSFLNVVIYRCNTGKTIGGRSACMSCLTTLKWYELVPLFSFVVLFGRCRTCKIKISIQYPLVELVTGIIFATVFYVFRDLLFTDPAAFILSFKYYALIFSLLLALAVYDLKHKIIPDTFSFAFGALAFVGLFFFVRGGGFAPHLPSILDLLAGPLIALPFYLLWLVSGGAWMGFGDVKLAVGIGWFLGIARGLSAVTIGFWAGAIIGIVLVLLSKKYKMKSQIPFAPYLVLGTFIAFVFDLHLFTPF